MKEAGAPQFELLMQEIQRLKHQLSVVHQTVQFALGTDLVHLDFGCKMTVDQGKKCYVTEGRKHFEESTVIMINPGGTEVTLTFDTESPFVGFGNSVFHDQEIVVNRPMWFYVQGLGYGHYHYQFR